ncbi:hypothetical protein ANN_13450 [Periplaneta americana]|uniref:GIY-YIG domain-containing protein n=1 Tax=Periplaneta americana TaxID=6978 RepID=A0ABQ8TKF6_PERAM|nr:hypothetical protein ANN_13450 [Periplaneta americana]
MSPGSNTESYLAFAHIGLRENPGKNLNQVTCPDRESNPGHLVSRPDALTVIPQEARLRYTRYEMIMEICGDATEELEFTEKTHVLPGPQMSVCVSVRVSLSQEMGEDDDEGDEGKRANPSLMLAGNEFQSLGRAIVKEDEYEEVRWDGIVSIVSWRERVFRLWWEESRVKILECSKLSTAISAAIFREVMSEQKVESLLHRAIVISDINNLPAEMDHLRRTLQQNNYSRRDINNAIKQVTMRSNTIDLDSKQEPTKKAFIPFCGSVSHKISRILQKVNIKTIHKPQSKIRSHLRQVKDSQGLRTPGIYKIPCECGEVYIGQTGRTIEDRIKEHKRNPPNFTQESREGRSLREMTIPGPGLADPPTNPVSPETA